MGNLSLCWDGPRACWFWLASRHQHRRHALKAVLKMVLGTGAMAGAVSMVLVVQSFATYGSLVPVVRVGAPPSVPGPKPGVVQLSGVSVDGQHGMATLTMTPFTSESLAKALGAKFGMQLLADYPSFGQYIFSLPQIRIGSGPEQHTATIYFPPYASSDDINGFLNRNRLQTRTW